MRKLPTIAIFILAANVCAVAQFTYGDKDVLALGYDLTIGSGFTLNVGSGVVNCGSAGVLTYPGGSFTFVKNTTNYVYLNGASLCSPTATTSGFPAGVIPLGIVTTNKTAIIPPLVDYRGIMSLAFNNGGGGGGSLGVSTNGVANASQTLLNFMTSTVNASGLTVTPFNTSLGNETFEITGTAATAVLAATATTATTATTASQLTTTPTQCSGGQFSTGIQASGNANCSASPGAGPEIASTLYVAPDPNYSTDDTAGLQAWLNAVGVSPGGTGILAAGQYKVTSALTFPSGVKIRGVGTSGGGPGTGGPQLGTTSIGCFTSSIVAVKAGIPSAASYKGGELDDITFVDKTGGGTCGGAVLLINESYFRLKNVAFQGFHLGTTAAPATPSLTPGTSGSLSSGTYYVAITDADTIGHETLAGTAVSAMVSSSGSIAIAAHTPTAPMTCWNAYAGTSATALHLISSCITSGMGYTITALAGGNVYNPVFDESMGYGVTTIGTSGGMLGGLSGGYSNQVIIDNPQCQIGTLNCIVADRNVSSTFIHGGNLNLYTNTTGCGMILSYAFVTTHTESGGSGATRACLDGFGGSMDIGLDQLASGETGISMKFASEWRIYSVTSVASGSPQSVVLNSGSTNNLIWATGTGTAQLIYDSGSANQDYDGAAATLLLPGATTVPTGASLGPTGSGTVTATQLAATPAQCSGVQFSTGIQVNGDSNCATPSGGGGSGVTLQTNTVANTSQVLLNFETSTANVDGLTVTPSNPSGGIEQFEVSGTVNATQVNGAVVPASAQLLGSNSSRQLVAAPYPSSSLPTVYANGEGNDSNDGLKVETAKLSINAAIDALPNGGFIIIGQGAHLATASDPVGVGIWLMGAYSANYAIFTAPYTVTGATWSAGLETVTTNAGTFALGMLVTIASVNPSGVNGTFQLTAGGSHTMTFPLVSNPGSYVSGGTATLPGWRKARTLAFIGNAGNSGTFFGRGAQVGITGNGNTTQYFPEVWLAGDTSGATFQNLVFGGCVPFLLGRNDDFARNGVGAWNINLWNTYWNVQNAVGCGPAIDISGQSAEIFARDLWAVGTSYENAAIASIARVSGTVNVITATQPTSWSGESPLTLNVFGIGDSSFNGDYASTITASTTFTYPQAGPNSNSVLSLTNVSETASNVVTLTLATGNAFVIQDPDGTLPTVALSGLTTATWLNSHTVQLGSASSTTITLTDPTSHGLQSSAAETGTAAITLFAQASSDQGQAIVINPGTDLGNTFVAENLFTYFGAIKAYAGSEGVQLHLNHVLQEAGVAPPVYLTTCTAPAVMDVNDITAADVQANFAGVRADCLGNASASFATTDGPMTLGQNAHPFNTYLSPLVLGESGAPGGFSYNQTNASRANFPPVATRFLNLSPQTPTSWYNTSGATYSPATAPDGTNNATTISGGTIYFKLGNVTDNPGDTFLCGAWILLKGGTAPTGFGCNLTAATFTQSWSFQQGPPQNGSLFGDWVWLGRAYKISSTTNTTAQMNFSPGTISASGSETVYAPILLRVPSGTLSDNDLTQLAQNLSTYRDDSVVGQTSLLRGIQFKADSINLGGTTFTAAGCSATSLSGSATAGSFLSGVTGTCTNTITMGAAQAAPHGWTCWASDQTTPADIFSQKSGGSTTTAVLTGTTVLGDLVSFGCLAY